MRVNTNIAALNALRNLNITNQRMDRSLERLASGLRINRAADDAAGLAISEKMRGQIRGLNQAIRNAQDGISLIQTAEGALNESHAILQRMRELAVQAASDTYTAADRQEIQKEIDQLTTELNRIANTTEFNTKQLLDGTTSALTSTDRLSTQVFMRDGLRVEDQFGQKAVGGGNYRIGIQATPGQAQVQKTDQMKIKHAGGTAEVDTVTQGTEESDAVFDLSFDENTADGNFTLLVGIGEDDPVETGPIAWTSGDMAGNIQSALEGLAGIEVGDVSVTEANGVFRITFEGNLEQTPVTLAVGENDLEDSGTAAVISGTADMTQNINELNTTQAQMTISVGEDDYVVDLIAWTAGQAIGDLVDAMNTAITSGATVTHTGGVITITQDAALGGTAGTITVTYQAAGDDAAEALTRMAALTGITNNATDTGTAPAAVDDPGVRVMAEGTEGVNEVQEITLTNVADGTFTLTYVEQEIQTIDLDTPTSGTFTLGRGAETEEVAYDAGEAGIQDALDSLYGEGMATVVENLDGTFTITFSAELEAASGLTFDGTGLSSAAGADMTLDQAYATHTTDDIAYDATAGTVQAALEALAPIAADDVLVEGGAGGPWTVTFQNNLGEQNISQLVLDDSNLEGLGQIGDLADLNTSIYDIDRFWDASGNFLVRDPQTITLVQGDGSRASFTIFENDTIQDIQDKMNTAIAQGLGQEQYVDGEDVNFVSYVSQPNTTGNESVQGTFVIRSAVTGAPGEINFVGSEKVINALSLTTIQQARENQFTINVADAHSGDEVAADVRITGNMLVGVVHQNVDVRFDNMANVAVEVNTAGDFVFSQSAEDYFTTVHLSDNTMVFHIGANPLQDVASAIGDMRAAALGVDNIQVTDRESANRAIAQIDNAIDRVSAERSKMGAMQNRLEHTIANLGTSAENLTAAESRIRDLDMAAEMAEFTRNQILLQAGTAMLAQANMKPQAVLQLLG